MRARSAARRLGSEWGTKGDYLAPPSHRLLQRSHPLPLPPRSGSNPCIVSGSAACPRASRWSSLIAPRVAPTRDHAGPAHRRHRRAARGEAAEPADDPGLTEAGSAHPGARPRGARRGGDGDLRVGPAAHAGTPRARWRIPWASPSPSSPSAAAPTTPPTSPRRSGAPRRNRARGQPQQHRSANRSRARRRRDTSRQSQTTVVSWNRAWRHGGAGLPARCTRWQVPGPGAACETGWGATLLPTPFLILRRTRLSPLRAPPGSPRQRRGLPRRKPPPPVRPPRREPWGPSPAWPEPQPRGPPRPTWPRGSPRPRP